MTRVLVTGGSGFCGKHLVAYLQKQGVEVYTVGVQPAIDQPNKHYSIADITSVEALSSVLKSVEPNYVFHLAGVASAPEPSWFYQVNASYAAALLRALELTGQLPDCPTMLVGTSAEYGFITPEQVPIHEKTPVSPYHHYGISKLAQTHIGMAAARASMPVVMVRPFNIIGCGMGSHLALQSFARQVANILQGKQDPVIEVGNLGSSRDFIDVGDVIPIYWQLIQNPDAYGEVINVCSGQGVVMSDLLQKLIEIAAVEVEVRSDPSRMKALDIPVHYGCTKKLESLIGDTPKLNLDATLKQILEQLIADA
ncbi:MAG TPA: NAD-dependent epimerase/dehydratase family protein [Trichocoleus sp.]|jgi:GDP-4-dehydro-6-deoxy-D-mannose reductase